MLTERHPHLLRNLEEGVHEIQIRNAKTLNYFREIVNMATAAAAETFNEPILPT